jgi:TonB family protein
MSTGSRNEVFTVSEVARAGGVPTEAVQTLIGRGELNFIAGTRYIAVPSPVRTARLLREAALALHAQPAVALFTRADTAPPRTRKPAVASLTAHAAVAVLIVLLSMGRTESASIVDSPHEESHLVFLMSPGPGGGGGGGGLRQPEAGAEDPAENRATASATLRCRRPKRRNRLSSRNRKPPEPEPPKEIIAPVETVAANEVDRVGQIEHAAEAPQSNGPGSNGGVGTGQGSGNGEGLGSGIGEGEGGGTGGGPYRPGSGIEPPRLLHEVKAQYTEDARRRGIAGDVLLEVVVRRDGSVGDAHVLHGLGYGLDERAISAVRQWRFAAAQRKGVPVDVLVEVAVEFTLR